jgi:hypothetical protein
VDESTVDARIRDHFAAIGRDEDAAASIYADDAVLEYPQGNERIRGRANIVASRRAYPGRPSSFVVQRVFGTPELRAVELTLLIEGDEPHPVVAIVELRDGLVTRERMYIAEPWDPPDHRARWAEPIDPDVLRGYRRGSSVGGA